MADILPSQGTEAKEAQIKASSQENGVEDVKESPKEVAPAKVEKEEKAVKPVVNGDNELEVAHVQEEIKPVKQADNPIWKMNDPCSAFCKDLNKEANCTIYQLHPSKKDMVKVKFIETKTVEVKNINEIKKPIVKGEDVVDHRPISKGVIEETKPVKSQVEKEKAPVQEKSPQPIVNGVAEGNGPDVADKSMDSETSTSSQSSASTVIEVAPLQNIAEEADGGADPNISAGHLEMTKLLLEQLDANGIIKDLREQLALRDKRLKQAHDRNEVNEIIFREIRLSNAQLSAENARLLKNEQKYLQNQATLMADIKSLLSKVRL